MNADTFCTRTYKGHFIHTCYDRDIRRELVKWQAADTNRIEHVKSYRAAQLAITRYIKSQKDCTDIQSGSTSEPVSTHHTNP